METYLNRISAFDKEQVYTLDDRAISNEHSKWDLKDVHGVHLSFLAILFFRLVPYYKKNRPVVFSARQIPSLFYPKNRLYNTVKLEK